MNKAIIRLIQSTAAASLIVLSSCSIDDEGVSRNYNLSVEAILPDEDATSQPNFSGGQVTVSNDQTGQIVAIDQVRPDYTFQIPGGNYTVTVSWRSNDGGTVTAYSASRAISVFDDTNLALQLSKSVAGGLIFKEVYYNMVKPNGKTPYMRDNFYEIYNNSDETLYLDNCILGMLEGSQTATPSAWMKDGELMDEYAMGYYTVAFVSTSGKDYPLAPGKSIVIANQAINHTRETEASYTPSVAGAMKSPVDLSNADYEVCLIDYKPAVALDNPDVPNMTVIYHNGTQNYFNLPYTGNAIILAKLPDGMSPIDFANDPNNIKARPDGVSPTVKYLVIPQKYVLDGLNIVNNADKADKRCIRLRAEVDAGILFMDAPYQGKSVRRKVESITPDGRVKFKDTNNSTEDFLREQIPTPGIIPTTLD